MSQMILGVCLSINFERFSGLENIFHAGSGYEVYFHREPRHNCLKSGAGFTGMWAREDKSVWYYSAKFKEWRVLE